MGQATAQFLTAIAVLLYLLGLVWTFDDIHKSMDAKYRAVPQFAFAKHFQDHMVLQQAPAKSNIYGFSPDIGQVVYLQVVPSVEPVVYQTTVKQGPEPGGGVWSFTLDPLRGNTTVAINVRSGNQNLTLSDVLVGDVWICSGQSNMEFTVIQMFGAEEELADAHNYPNIRIMTVEDVQSFTPLYDLSQIRQAWTAPNRDTVGGPEWQYFSAVCWLYGKAIHKTLGYPIGLVATDWGGTPVEAWSSPQALAACGVNSSTTIRHQPSRRGRPIHKQTYDRLEGPTNNSVLWNAMIYPLLGMTIKGAIWYQETINKHEAESVRIPQVLFDTDDQFRDPSWSNKTDCENDDSGDMMNRYNCTFPAMIKDWRSNFHKVSNGQTDAFFPFGFVQLAPDRPDPDLTVGFPDIRWHQTADHGFVPNADLINVFMAVTIDLPDFNSSYDPIHPRDKTDVADRLVLSGLSVAYGRNVVFQGPFPKAGETLQSGLVISYGDRWNLDVRTTEGFEFLCINAAERTWTRTSIISSNQTSITLQLSCQPGHHIAGLRYAWRESPCEFKKCAVYETVNGLPAPPFIIGSSGENNGYPRFKFRH